MNNFFNKIIKEITKEENIKYKNISDGYITVLEKGGIYKYINEFKFGLNSQVSSILCDDKYAMYEVLKYHHIPVIEHQLVWDVGKNKKEINTQIEYLKEYFKDHNNHIVLKPNDGYSGIMVFNIQKIDDIEESFLNILNWTKSIVVNPFYKIKNEHRIIILKGKCRLMYTKELPKNGWQFNLSKGSKAIKITDEKLKNELQKLALKAYNLIDVNFVSVDIIEDYHNNFYILEINSGVCMEKYVREHPEDYNIVKDIYHDAIKELFKQLIN